MRIETTPTVNVHEVFDIPFSAVADTLMLPYTIPKSYENAAHPERAPIYSWDGMVIRQ